MVLRPELQNFAELAGIKGNVIRAIERPERRTPAETILKTLRTLEIPTLGGTVKRSSIQAENKRVIDALFWIVRGLHYYHTNYRISVNSNKNTWSYEGSENKRVFEKCWSQASNGPYSIGNTLTYKFSFIPEVPEFADWHLVFYDRVYHILTIGEDVLEKKAREMGVL